ncbi:glycosyltransferase [Kallotenue papyrolyticum]|uniref:glycosyltransferase n=1 Tax=Kallotenue papyrolyticum TaxID=1325125 RepID=UPI0004785B52|nr:glycosyltransferase [Kallotenue papyrolyticum]
MLWLVTAAYLAMRALLSWGLTRPTPRSQAQPRVAVVVAAHNAAATLPVLLEELTQQRYPDYEVIVVDDRSSDATPAVLEMWTRRCARLTALRVERLPAGVTPKMHALARGIERADGELLLLTDADCRVSRDWIAAMASYFTPGVGVVIGYAALQPRRGRLLEQLQALDYLHMMALTAGATRLGYPLGAGGANLAYRRASYLSAGGFDGLPRGAVADDMLMLQQILERTTCRAAFCDDPRARVTTPAEPTLQRLLAQRARWMTGGAEVLWRNPPLLALSSLIGLSNGLLLCAPLLWRRPALRRATATLLGGRVLADALHLAIAARHFGALRLLPFLPVWLIAQALATAVLPLYSRLSGWRWGGRRRP